MRIYRDILKSSFILTLKNKYFWFFGLFASLVGISSEYEFFFKGLGGSTGESYFLQYKKISATGILSFSALKNIANLFKTETISMLVILILGIMFLVLIVFIIWLSVVSQVAIVNNSSKMILKKATDFKEGIVAGTKNFWKVLAMNIFIKISMSIIFLIIGIPFLFKAISVNMVMSNLLYILLFVIFVPIGIIIAFIVKYAIAFVVIKEESFFNALKLGWKLFQKNWLVSVEMAFILFFINLLAILLIALIVLILVIPILFIAFLFNYIFASLGFWIVFVLGILALIIIFTLGGAIISSFHIVSWTKFFIELSSRGVTSKISRVIEGFNK